MFSLLFDCRARGIHVSIFVLRRPLFDLNLKQARALHARWLRELLSRGPSTWRRRMLQWLNLDMPERMLLSLALALAHANAAARVAAFWAATVAEWRAAATPVPIVVERFDSEEGWRAQLLAAPQGFQVAAGFADRETNRWSLPEARAALVVLASPDDGEPVAEKRARRNLVNLLFDTVDAARRRLSEAVWNMTAPRWTD